MQKTALTHPREHVFRGDQAHWHPDPGQRGGAGEVEVPTLSETFLPRRKADCRRVCAGPMALARHEL